MNIINLFPFQLKYLIVVIFSALTLCEATGQIIYTDIDPDTIISASVTEVIASYYLDLNNNGMYEFELRHFNPGGMAFVEIHQNPNMNTTQEVLLNSSGLTKPLSYSEVIGPNSGPWGSDWASILQEPGTWYDGTDKYIGIRFKISNAWRYGWARINIATDSLSFTVKDYAYQSMADAGLYAGSISDTNNGFIELGINQPPQLQAHAGDDTSIISGNSVIIGGIPSATGGTPGYTYNWSPSTGLNDPASPNPVASPGQSTVYTLIVTDDADCTATDEASVIVTYAIPEQFISEITVYPNPSGELIKVRLDGTFPVRWLLIFDSRGRKVIGSGISNSESTLYINVNDLQKGIYLLRLGNDECWTEKTFIIN
jgi:hypothetical protein